VTRLHVARPTNRPSATGARGFSRGSSVRRRRHRVRRVGRSRGATVRQIASPMRLYRNQVLTTLTLAPTRQCRLAGTLTTFLLGQTAGTCLPALTAKRHGGRILLLSHTGAKTSIFPHRSWSQGGRLTICVALRIIRPSMRRQRKTESKLSAVRPNTLAALTKCLHRYVEANPSRFLVREETVGGRRVLVFFQANSRPG
jgi:hypothetical protein